MTRIPDASRRPSSGLQRRATRVLIVDDEALVAQAIARFLSDEHEVDAVSGGREALDAIERGERYDAILCDVSMPGLNGMDVYEHLRGEHPELAERIVFISGGVIDPRLQRFFAGIRNPVVEKPPDIAELRALLRQRVDVAVGE